MSSFANLMCWYHFAGFDFEVGFGFGGRLGEDGFGSRGLRSRLGWLFLVLFPRLG